MHSKLRFVFALVTLSLGLGLHLRASEPAFKLQNTWKLGGDGSWDYLAVDPTSHILYIARLNRIMLVNVQSGKLVNEITGLNHAHGIAFDDRGKVGYISDGGAGAILVFDRATYKILATIPAGKNPDAVLFEPTQRRVFAFNGGSHDATVIDAATNHVITTVPTPGRPEFSVTDGAGNVFVNIEDASVVLRLDAANSQSHKRPGVARLPGRLRRGSPSIMQGIVSSRFATTTRWSSSTARPAKSSRPRRSEKAPTRSPSIPRTTSSSAPTERAGT